MKVVVEEVKGEGFEALMGKRITVLCVNYFYTGKLMGVNDTCILLKDPAIVYETGPWGSAYKNEQELPSSLYVQKAAVEAFGVLDA